MQLTVVGKIEAAMIEKSISSGGLGELQVLVFRAKPVGND